MSREADRLCCLPSQTVGPFYHVGLSDVPPLGCLASPEVPGEHIHLRFRLFDGDGQSVPDGIVELWQADALGNYSQPAFCGFARLATDAEGICYFETVRPGRVPDGRGGYQAAHINVTIFARGLLDRLCTRVYFAGDAALVEDLVLALVPEDRRQTLFAQHNAESDYWSFDIHLQGARETVFFDV